MKPDAAIGILERLTTFEDCSEHERQSARELLLKCQLLIDELADLGALKLGEEPLVLIQEIEIAPTLTRLLDFGT